MAHRVPRQNPPFSRVEIETFGRQLVDQWVDRQNPPFSRVEIETNAHGHQERQ